MRQSDTTELKVRLQSIENIIKRLELEVEAMKAETRVNSPRLDRFEAELKGAEKELASLQGQGVAHGVRLDGIERALNQLGTQIAEFHNKLRLDISAVVAQLSAHTNQEEAWQRKVYMAIIGVLFGVVVSGLGSLLLYMLNLHK